MDQLVTLHSRIGLMAGRKPLERQSVSQVSAVVLAVLVIISLTGCLWPAWRRDPLEAIPPAFACAGFCALFPYLWDERGKSGKTALLLSVAGILWPANYYYQWGGGLAVHVSMIGSSSFWWIVTWAFFLYPRRRLDFVERLFIAALGCSLLLPDFFLLINNGGYQGLPFLGPLDITLAVAAAALAIRRITYSRGIGRRVVFPVFLAGIILAVSAGLSWVLLYQNGIYSRAAAQGNIDRIYSVESWILLVVPAAFVTAGLHGRLIQGAVADQLARLSYRMSAGEITEALRRALRDDRIDILYWAPDLRAYVDQGGHVADRPADSERQVVIPLGTRKNEHLAVLVADRELAREAVLLGHAVTASRAPLLAACLEAAHLAQKEQQHAQHRLIEKALWAQRQGFARDLHDGAQQRLSALGFLLARAEQQAGPVAAAETVREIRRQLDSALVDIRRIAHGLAPVELEEKGLHAAVSSLCELQDLSISQSVTKRRHRPEVEFLAYNVIAEALTNVMRHSQASCAMVRCAEQGDFLMVQVIDDGAGGAVVGSGSGLAGIQGRVNAIGGKFRIKSDKGSGTNLTVGIPCALSLPMIAPSTGTGSKIT